MADAYCVELCLYYVVLNSTIDPEIAVVCLFLPTV